jgi:hypothetical protein
MEERLEQNPDDWQAKRFFEKKKNRGKNKKCSYCQGPGHQRRTCKELKYAKVIAKRTCGEWRKKLVHSLKAAGVGVGTLVNYSLWSDDKLGIITAILWDKLDHRIGFDYGGDAAALVVAPVESVAGTKTLIYIPVVEEVFSKVGVEYYREKTPTVVGPIKADLVSQQVPENYFSGESCINDIFAEDGNSQDRPTFQSFRHWCALQGFYAECPED